MEITVNGKTVSIEPRPGEMLADMLRERLNLTGTKVGCNEAECGSCTVLINDEPVLSCTYPSAKAAGKNILTIEGLAGQIGEEQEDMRSDGQEGGVDNALHPLQEAFINHGAVQCGFCIPGQLMTAYALLEENSEPSSSDIRHALKDTLCRCAGYPTIERAIQAAAKSLRSNTIVEPPIIAADSHEPKDIIGTRQIRPDAVDKVTGAAKFTDDLKFPGMLHAAVKRAGIPHGILKHLNIERSVSLPGVIAVLTAADIPGEQNHGLVIYDWPAIIGIGEHVRYLGDSVAIVAAESREIALQAVQQIEAVYEPLEVVADPVRAKEADAPQLHENGNMLKHIKVRKGDMAQGFKEADIILEHTFHTQTTDHAFMEPECSIAVPTPDKRMEIYVATQIPNSETTHVART